MQVTGYHRKSAIRLLNRERVWCRGKRRGRRRRHGDDIGEALREVWEASDHLGSKRLKPFMGELVRKIRQHGEVDVNADIEAELCDMSPSTIDRFTSAVAPCSTSQGYRTIRPKDHLVRPHGFHSFANHGGIYVVSGDVHKAVFLLFDHFPAPLKMRNCDMS